MNENKSVRFIAFACTVLIMLSFALTAFAEGGNGDGTGGGKDKPLELAESSIANGAKNVSTTPEITLTFTKNVVHFTVRDNNLKCFSMTDSKGADVPIDVIMGDDQVDPSIKRIVTVKPKFSLTPDETYILKIDKNVTSKSGVSLGKNTYISFTVAKSETSSTSKPASTAAPASSARETPVTRSSGSNSGDIVTTVTENRLSTISGAIAETTERTSRTSRTTTTAAPKTTKAAKTTAAEKSTSKAVTTTVKTTAAKTEPVKKTTAATSADITVITTVQTSAETITAETITSVTEYSGDAYESQSDLTETENPYIPPSDSPEDEMESPAEKTERNKYTPFIIGAVAVTVLLAGAATVFLLKKKH